MGHALGNIANIVIPTALTATGHPELAAAYSGASSYAKTGDPLAALTSAGTQYAGSQFFGKTGQLGAPSATDPLASGINAGTQLATEAAEQASLSGLEALKTNAMANSINPALGNSFGDTVRIASDAAAKDAMLNSGAPLFNPQAITPLTGGSVADAASSPVLTSYPYAQQVNPLAAVNPATASLASTTVPFDSLSMGDKLGAFGKGLGSLTSSSGRQALVDAYGGSALKAGLGAAAFASPVLTPLLTPEPMQTEESYWGGPSESLEDLRRRVRGYAEGGDVNETPDPGSNPIQDAQEARSYGIGGLSYADGGKIFGGPSLNLGTAGGANFNNSTPGKYSPAQFEQMYNKYNQNQIPMAMASGIRFRQTGLSPEQTQFNQMMRRSELKPNGGMTFRGISAKPSEEQMAFNQQLQDYNKARTDYYKGQSPLNRLGGIYAGGARRPLNIWQGNTAMPSAPGPSESLESVRRRVRGYAEGGITGLQMGGVFDARTHMPEYDEPLDTYAKGGYLNGPGDGMSDSIPATIANKQPARLADGEFVVPADVVSHLGNGSTKAGAQRLYAMMDKVRKARTGTTKQGRQIDPAKYLPA